MNLYEIDEAILACVDQETGEIIDETALDELEMNRDRKIENIACWVKDLNADSAALDNEIKALQARKKAADAKAASLKSYLGNYLGTGNKWTSARAAISWRTSNSVEVENPGMLPDQYLRFKDPEPDKMLIKAALKNGAVFDPDAGVKLVVNKNIQIK